MSTAQYLTLLGLWIAGIASPGPDILVILRNAFLSSRRKAMLTALGVMMGNILWITLSLTGVTVLINQHHVLKLVIQVAGALFLAWMGYASLRSAHAARATRAGQQAGAVSAARSTATAAGTQAPWPAVADDDAQVPHAPHSARGGGVLGTRDLTGFRAVVQGMVTNLSNPKAIIFFIALFASVVPANAQWWESTLVAVLLFVVGLAWFCTVAWFGSVPRLAAMFQEHTAVVEAITGVVFLAVAVLLLVEAVLVR